MTADEEYSTLELYTGIIVACMPAASRASHHIFPSYKIIKPKLLHPWLFSLFTSRLQSSVKGSSADGSKQQHPAVRNLNIAYKSPYRDLDSFPDGIPVDEGSKTLNESLRTFIHGGGKDDMDNDGIWLTYEMQQTACQNKV